MPVVNAFHRGACAVWTSMEKRYDLIIEGVRTRIKETYIADCDFCILCQAL